MQDLPNRLAVNKGQVGCVEGGAFMGLWVCP
jgi:hypothetical protein